MGWRGNSRANCRGVPMGFIGGRQTPEYVPVPPPNDPRQLPSLSDLTPPMQEFRQNPTGSCWTPGVSTSESIGPRRIPRERAGSHLVFRGSPRGPMGIKSRQYTCMVPQTWVAVQSSRVTTAGGAICIMTCAYLIALKRVRDLDM